MSDVSAGSENAPHIGPRLDARVARERFAPHELAIVLSRYDLGSINRIKEYPRGSSRAPKVRIETDRGEFLLKRRAPGRDQPIRVAFCHSIQLALAASGFPTPNLIGTRDDNNSMLQLNGSVYEMFEFVRGKHYQPSNRAAQYSGYTLARMHRMLAKHEARFEAPRGSYHAGAGMDQRFAYIPYAVSAVEDDADQSQLETQCSFLMQAYQDAGKRVCDLGYPEWTLMMVHGDWHPGNLLFRDHEVVAVLDFDSARLEPRMMDIANGALQFSMDITAPESPLEWPEGLNIERLRAFVVGYHQQGIEPLTEAEIAALPWLVIEALIAESVIPIAATGRFARIRGSEFLSMIERKVTWLQPRAGKLVEFLSQAPDNGADAPVGPAPADDGAKNRAES